MIQNTRKNWQINRWLFENFNKVDKALPTLIREKQERETQIRLKEGTLRYYILQA